MKPKMGDFLYLCTQNRCQRPVYPSRKGDINTQRYKEVLKKGVLPRLLVKNSSFSPRILVKIEKIPDFCLL